MQRSTADSIPSPSRSILRKPASPQESLSHCTIWRPSIDAGCTGQRSISGWVEITIPPGCCDMCRGSPHASCASFTSASQRGEPAARHLALDVVRSFHGSTWRASRSISPGGSPSAFAKSRTAERTWKVEKAATSAHAVAAVAVVHARDQHLADVAREVEVDVRQRGELLVQEAAEEQLVGDRVDVREPGEVADDRRHARPTAAAGRQQAARRLRPAHLRRHLARQLEHVAVEQEEAGQAEVADHAQLLVEPRGRLGVAAES